MSFCAMSSTNFGSSSWGDWWFHWWMLKANKGIAGLTMMPSVSQGLGFGWAQAPHKQTVHLEHPSERRFATLVQLILVFGGWFVRSFFFMCPRMEGSYKHTCLSMLVSPFCEWFQRIAKYGSHRFLMSKCPLDFRLFREFMIHMFSWEFIRSSRSRGSSVWNFTGLWWDLAHKEAFARSHLAAISPIFVDCMRFRRFQKIL